MITDLDGSTCLIDARWLGIGGAGRVTQNLLSGLRVLQPAGRWLIWGPPQCRDLCWPGAEWVPQRFEPTRSMAQREQRSMRSRAPDVALFVHQIRPMRRVAPVEVTVIHDTIGLRYPTRGVPAALFRVLLRRAAALSTVVATVSEHSARCIVDDLGVCPDRVHVLAQPIDHESAARVRAKRAGSVPTLDALYVGRDAPHKNLDRAVRAFAGTRLCREGGAFVLVGVDERAARRLGAVAASCGARVRFPGVVGQEELESLLGSCAVLVQPSLEEGFGLPAAEALAAGVPAAVSRGGALAEVVGDAMPTFDPFDVAAMTAAIDAAAARATGGRTEWPAPVDLARSCLDALTRAVQRRDLTTR
jgi:glycosyltransferase involved in cell wall biosynthesis